MYFSANDLAMRFTSLARDPIINKPPRRFKDQWAHLRIRKRLGILKSMKKICSAPNLMEAQIMLDLLGHASISARLFNEHAQGGLGDIPFTHAYPEVWVIRDSDFERGQAIVKAFEKMPLENRVVFCRACGEENPRNFQLCWHCSAGLEGFY
jgi:putative signal transducing protein